jgi:hypothetical protein
VLSSQSCAIAMGEDASLGVGDAHGDAAGEEMGVRPQSAGCAQKNLSRLARLPGQSHELGLRGARLRDGA